MAKALFKIEGDRQLLRALDKLGKNVAKKVLGKAVRAAGKPVLKAAKSKVPRRTGSLSRALMTKVKRYKNGNIVAVIGPRKGQKSYKATKRKEARTEDAFYGHMVEEGVQPHDIFPRSKRGALIIDGYIYGRVRHPGMRGSHFLERSFNNRQTTAKRAFMVKAWREIEIEAAKASK